MKKGHPFMLQIPMLQVARVVVGQVCQLPGSDPFTVHSITSIEIDKTKAVIIGFTAKEEKSEKR